ncbi:glycosyltransferase [Halobacteroides halobius DSM 5150]|uniref:Glycosyltransferase n=1 Tax=Halobacteroides halobius (strain ATCC 35273 / DSM 5150 / MD-1) TaxID=748449 RepID=L0K9K8_HALHC|nr:glycosyltransferase [Halobacteroides halobius]AGB41225.1 glycosyltransferase [Halobacteroides halobius DSM 5150]
MKVGILTMFNGLSSTYSLVNVVAEQLKMLLNNNIKTKLLVTEHCSAKEQEGIYKDERIEWAKVTNTLNGEQIHWHDYTQAKGAVHDTFFAEAEVIAEDLIEKLADVDVCIMHDIHYQGWHLVHNVAVRKAQKELPNTKFIAFTHSFPANRPSNPEWPFSARYTPMPNTIYAYPTYSGISALSKQYNVPQGKCRVVNNSLNLLENMSQETQTIAKNIDILSSDILIVYPGRLTPGKRFERVAAFAGAMKSKTEQDIKVVFCDFKSSDIKPAKYKRIITEAGYNFGLQEEDILFTSDLGYPDGIPRETVLELFTLSNLFICPSFSESFGLTVLEAASRGNFLVLNERVPALEELGKKLNAYFMRWDARNYGYNTKEEYQPSEEVYYQEHGENILNLMRENNVLHAKSMVRKRYSPQWIWRNQLEPLLD